MIAQLIHVTYGLVVDKNQLQRRLYGKLEAVTYRYTAVGFVFDKLNSASVCGLNSDKVSCHIRIVYPCRDLKTF